MTENRFIEYIQIESSHSLTFKESLSDCLLFDYSSVSRPVTPLKYNLEDEHFYFPFVRGRASNLSGDALTLFITL